MKSPLRRGYFAVLDSVHQKGLKDELVKMGMVADNVIIWEQNGIKYLYPQDALASIFSCDVSRIKELEITGDRIKLNGVEKTKNDLKNEIISKIGPTVIVPEEFEQKFLTPLIKSVL